jgi:Peptidase family C25
MLATIWALSVSAQSSVLHNGDWYRFAIQKNGVYKITYDFLKKNGIDLAGVDPRTIQLFGNAGGMLPQPNSTPRPNDLTELAIFVSGEDDGVFNSDDYILFYGEGADRVDYDVNRDIFFYEHNLYADENFYFLTVGDVNGRRIEAQESLPGSFPSINDFDDYVFHEKDLHNILKSGREWYGETFDVTTSMTLPWKVTGIEPNSTVKFVSEVMAQSGAGSSFTVFINNSQVGEQSILPISGYQYAVKGQVKRDTFSVDSSVILAGNNSSLDIRYQYNKQGTGPSTGYLNFFLVSFKRALSMAQDQTIFRSASSLGNAVSTFTLSQVSEPITIWDISDMSQPKQQSFSVMNNKASFSTGTTTLKNFVAFTERISQPMYAGKVPNQDLHSMLTPNLLIITHPLFRAEAERLAMHRRQQSGWTVAVATTDEVFNEFSSGRQDVSAIRDFAKYLYDKNPDQLKSLLLFGRGSYDYKDHLAYNTNFVPMYESRSSLYPLDTYSSDDYFGFMGNQEGNWGEEITDYSTMDIGVGRLPVKSPEEAADVVDKIITYETNQTLLGNWRKQIVFVADDGDNNLHQQQADQLAQFVSSQHPEFDTRKIYLDAYQQILLPTGEAAPDANKRIEETLDQGALIINYTGHGAEKLWAQERIFDDFMIETLTNKNFPLFVTATCEFGRQDDPGQISSAELCVTRKNSGAIGMVSTARPVNSSTNFELNKAFYNALFEPDGNATPTLGEVFRRTKNNSINGVSNRNFSLLGDPSLQLAIPKLATRITSISSANSVDTLRALSHVFVTGEIVDDNQEKITSFSGVLQAVLYDKETNFTTLGNENAPFTFSQWSNALYRGKANVVNGDFEFEFIVPKNIAYQLGKGKLSLYAYDKSARVDAGGAELNFVVGQSDNNVDDDVTSPDISLFMGDTTFRNGGITSPDTRLIARLSDLSGINISAYGIGNNLIAALDEKHTFVLNDYYESDVNDYMHGWVFFPLKELAPGKHTISVKAWDTHNNLGEASIDFVVSKGDALAIELFGNYPNPFVTSTTLFFTHNRSGDDLMTTLSIFDVTGKLLKTQELTVPSSPYEVKLLELDRQGDFGENLKAGLYLARLIVRSLTNGSKNERVTKLIITN